MHGCGVKISKQPNGDFIAEEGQFVNDEWVGDVMACTVDQARAAAAESDIAAQMARVFEVRACHLVHTMLCLVEEVGAFLTLHPVPSVVSAVAEAHRLGC